jgi:hypothetical protein
MGVRTRQLDFAEFCQLYELRARPARSTLRAVVQSHGRTLVIDPSARPSGTGLAIVDGCGSAGPLASAPNSPLDVGLVHASPQRTG